MKREKGLYWIALTDLILFGKLVYDIGFWDGKGWKVRGVPNYVDIFRVIETKIEYP